MFAIDEMTSNNLKIGVSDLNSLWPNCSQLKMLQGEEEKVQNICASAPSASHWSSFGHIWKYHSSHSFWQTTDLCLQSCSYMSSTVSTGWSHLLPNGFSDSSTLALKVGGLMMAPREPTSIMTQANKNCKSSVSRDSWVRRCFRAIDRDPSDYREV